MLLHFGLVHRTELKKSSLVFLRAAMSFNCVITEDEHFGSYRCVTCFERDGAMWN